MREEPFHVVRVTFESGGERCVGYLHLPSGVAHPPVLLMGNGLASEWHFGTANFVRAFTAAGIATFNFDYRYFGESTGEPRQLLDFAKQLDDWRAALACLRTREEVDTTRIALWGFSLGGGHAISLAAEEPTLRAVITQVPHLNSRGAMKMLPKGLLIRTLGHALFDKLGALFGGSPHSIPVVAEPGEIGLLSKPGWKAHYLSLVPPGSQWRNAVPARSIFTAARYNPIDVAEKLKMPVMLVYALNDAAIPAVNVEIAAQRMADVTLLPFDGDHFDIYSGALHEEVVAAELGFLCEKLLVA